MQLAKLKEQKQKFCLSEVQLGVRIAPSHSHTETTVTLFAIHFIYLELDRDREWEREREGERGISTLAMHSTPTGIEFESFVQRGRTHMLMHTLPQSTQSPHRESSWQVASSAACAADQKPLIVIEWLRLQKKLLTVCPKVCAAFASVFCSTSVSSSALSLRVFVHLLRYT